MNCRDYQDQLAEYLGRTNLPANLASHLSACSECAAFLDEMRAIAEHLGSDRAFYPEPHEAELVAQVVEREIRVSTHITAVRPGWWVRLAGVTAAAVVILTAVTVTWRFAQQTGTTGPNGASSQIADTSFFDSQDETEELSADAIQLLLYDVTSGGDARASEKLLDDISVEEAAYLKTSLKAGDLL